MSHSIQGFLPSGRGLWRPAAGVLLGLGVLTGQAQTNYQQLLSFGPGAQSGSSPRGRLLEGSDGWLYGTTSGGGSNGVGTVFKVSKSGTDLVWLHSFNDGYNPWGGLVESSDGTLCGTTFSGASYYGSVFKLNKDGTGYSLLHTFTGSNGDGVQPAASLTAGQGGVLYGTTLGGGSANAGTIFTLHPDGGGYGVVHSFGGTAGGADGSGPAAALFQGADGVLYGTTQAGGSNDMGTVFRLNPDGSGYAVLHHFSGATVDGRQPMGSLLLGQDGKLYGTTYYGGSADVGTVFTLGTNGDGYAVLMSFAGWTQGSQPSAGLVRGTDGRLYGTTRYGGLNDGGTVFSVGTDGRGYLVLHSLSGQDGEGSQPFAALVRGSDGALYGSTYWGGDNGAGTLFRLYTPVAPVILSQSFGGGQFQLQFSGPDGQPYSVLATTNLAPPVSWTVLTNGIFSGTASFTDASAVAKARFYRVRSP